MKKSQQVPYSLRQGDVLLVDATYRGSKIAEGGKAVPLEGGRVVLMHGENTGHAHAIERPKSKARYFDAGAERFLQAVESLSVTHEEHSALFLSPTDPAGGKYHQAFQVEDFGDEVRRVAD